MRDLCGLCISYFINVYIITSLVSEVTDTSETPFAYFMYRIFWGNDVKNEN